MRCALHVQQTNERMNSRYTSIRHRIYHCLRHNRLHASQQRRWKILKWNKFESLRVFVDLKFCLFVGWSVGRLFGVTFPSSHNFHCHTSAVLQAFAYNFWCECTQHLNAFALPHHFLSLQWIWWFEHLSDARIRTMETLLPTNIRTHVEVTIKILFLANTWSYLFFKRTARGTHVCLTQRRKKVRKKHTHNGKMEEIQAFKCSVEMCHQFLFLDSPLIVAVDKILSIPIQIKCRD